LNVLSKKPLSDLTRGYILEMFTTWNIICIDNRFLKLSKSHYGPIFSQLTTKSMSDTESSASKLLGTTKFYLFRQLMRFHLEHQLSKISISLDQKNHGPKRFGILRLVIMCPTTLPAHDSVSDIDFLVSSLQTLSWKFDSCFSSNPSLIGKALWFFRCENHRKEFCQTKSYFWTKSFGDADIFRHFNLLTLMYAYQL